MLRIAMPHFLKILVTLVLLNFASLNHAAPVPPTCALTAAPASISAGDSSTLTASCSPAATSYVWTGGTCTGNTTNTCTVTPTASTNYTVTGTAATPATILNLGTTALVDAASAADVFSFDVVAAKTLTTVTQIPITGFDVTHDALQINTTTALGNVTLAALNGVDDISVQSNQITGSTLINFGGNANGVIVTLELRGVVDPALVYVAVNTVVSSTGNTASATVTVQSTQYNLSVTQLGTGSGLVTSTDGNINCSANCSGAFNSGSFVSLIATPDPDSAFTGWGGTCTGTGACPVTMDAARDVTANFNTAPFTVTTSGVTDEGIIIADPIATVTAEISFNTADVGKTGSVFVTALVPASFLETLVSIQGANRNYQAMAQMAAANPNALILVQLTLSGWEPVVDRQLTPYITGKLGTQPATLAILNNVDTTKLIGSQFCVGYGTDASEMTSAVRMHLIATIPDPNATNTNTRTCNVALPISDDQVFAYAEANYPNLFAGAVTPGVYQQYNYQLYSDSENYLAVGDDKAIYLYGPVSGYVISPVGLVESFRGVITDWEATLSP
jgi:hypothetical protein